MKHTTPQSLRAAALAFVASLDGDLAWLGPEAEALAAAVLGATSAPLKKQAKNRKQGPTSKAFGAAVRLPLYTKQACGHVFNSAGCAVCPQCERQPMRCDAAYPAEWALQDEIQAGVIADAKANASKPRMMKEAA